MFPWRYLHTKRGGEEKGCEVGETRFSCLQENLGLKRQLQFSTQNTLNISMSELDWYKRYTKFSNTRNMETSFLNN